MKKDRPKTAITPRPEGKPIHISPDCTTCGKQLVLLDLVYDPKCPENEILHDEWTCDQCNDGRIYFDWTKEELEEFIAKLEKENAEKNPIPKKELKSFSNENFINVNWTTKNNKVLN